METLRPQERSLAKARLAVLALPGIDNYVSDPDASETEIDRELETMVTDVTKQFDAENMTRFITYGLAWSDKEASSFFAHPERQPFQSKIDFAEDFEARREQFLAIGNYLGAKNEQVRTQEGSESEEREKAIKNLRIFHDYSTENLFGERVFGFQDKFNGFNPEDRRKGKIKPSEEILSLMEKAAKESAEEMKENWKKVYQGVIQVTEGGNYETAFSFLLNHQGHAAVRRALEITLEKRRQNKDLAVEKLHLLWKIEAYRLSMGIDLDLFYQINGLPKGSVIEERLHQFMRRDDLVAEMKAHLVKETPNVSKALEERGKSINFWEMLSERTRHQHLPHQPASHDELEAKKKRVWTEMAQFLPSIAFEETVTSFIYAPFDMGALVRGRNITYPNRKNRHVRFSIVNPRDEEILFAETTGHEIGHKLHAIVLRAAEDAGFVPERSWEKQPNPIKEEISRPVEDQVGKIMRAPKKEGEWRGLWPAYLSRRQAPYALTQRAVRKQMEEMWFQGKRVWDLEKEEITKILEELEPEVARWYAEGVPMVVPSQTVQSNIDLLDSLDGLAYLLKYVTEDERKYFDAKTAFENRFGEVWLDNKDARVVLFGLMTETGNNDDITTYGDFVLKADIRKIKERLKSWGFSEEDI